MKVVSLGSQHQAASAGQSTWTKSNAATPAAWPTAFLDFLSDLNEPLEYKDLIIHTDHSLVGVQHGRCGSEVVWTRETHLPGSWRVSAFHSNLVARLESFDSNQLERADGLAVVGSHFRAPLAIQTADCLAVGITAESSSEVLFATCFHAGWRGFTGGIQHNAMSLLNSQVSVHKHKPVLASDVFVTVGPAIAGKRFSCGEDVLLAFRDHHAHSLRTLPGWSEKHERAFWEVIGLGTFAESGKIQPDLQALMCIELHALGTPLAAITVFRDDTFGSHHWPSHRRAMAEGQPRAGRLITHLCPPTCP